MASHIPTTPRRALLSAAGFTGLTAVAAVGWVFPDKLVAAAPAQSHASPDAELISLCAYFDELEHQVVQSHREDGESEEVEAHREKLQDQQQLLLERIVTLRSTTLEGVQARARTLHLWDAELEPDGRYDDALWNDRMLWALVRDLVGAA